MSWQVFRKYLKFEIVLGLIVIAVLVVVILPPFSASLDEDQAFRTVSTAEKITRAVLDYHTDMRIWPPTGERGLDLACLTDGPTGQVQAMQVTEAALTMGSPAPNAGRPPKPWLKEIPLDAWHRPYHVLVMGTETDEVSMPASDLDPGKPAPYPKRPKDGVVIVAISAGPDGVLNTPLRPWKPAWLQESPFTGDDLGYVLAGG